MKSLVTFLAVAAALASPCASADKGEDVYKARCSLCHAGGAAGAPKLGNREDCEPRAARGRLALYQSALKGKPNTAMMARGGFRDLSEDEVMAAADYMIAQAGLHPGLHAEAPRAAPLETAPPPAAAPIDDKAATVQIAEALLEQLAPAGSKIEMQGDVANVGGLGIRVGTRQGVVWLRGTARTAEIIERAEAIARSAGGGRQVENRLTPASILESD